MHAWSFLLHQICNGDSEVGFFPPFFFTIIYLQNHYLFHMYLYKLYPNIGHKLARKIDFHFEMLIAPI